MTQNLDPTVFADIARHLERTIDAAESAAERLSDGVMVGHREWTALRTMGRAAVMLMQAVKWNDMADAPKDRAILVRIGEGVRVVQWYEPWGNWQEVGVELKSIAPEKEEMFGIGAKVPTGWMDAPETRSEPAAVAA